MCIYPVFAPGITAVCGLLLLLTSTVLAGRIFDVENIPSEKYVIEAGKNITIPCPGVNEQSLVNTLIWKTNTVIARYTNGVPTSHNPRIELQADNFGLYFNPLLARDSGEYTCLVNGRYSPEAIIDLVVQDVPDPPERPLIISFTSRSVNLSWAHSQDWRNAPVTHFIIETRVGENGPWDQTQYINTQSNLTTHQVTGLLPFTVYSFRLIAVNELGPSPPSKESYYIVTLREVPIGKPITTIAHNTSATSLYISWKPPPPDTILGEFLGYRITYRTRDKHNHDLREIYIRDSGVESHEIHDLETYTQYLVSIQVFNPEGLGPPTTVLVMTDEGVPSKPLNLTVVGVNGTSIRLSWIAPEHSNGAIQGYWIYYVYQNETLFKPCLKIDAATGQKIFYNLTNLRPYTEYKIYVQAYTWKNNGNNSDTIVQRTDIVAPSPPEIVNLTCQPEDKVYLRWKKPAEYYNSIDLYVISFKSREHYKFQEVPVKPLPMHLETSIFLPNISHDVYEVKVRAASSSVIYGSRLLYGEASEVKRIHFHENCDKIQAKLNQPRSDFNLIVIIGIVFSCFGIILIIMAFVLWRKCFHAAYYYLDDPPCQPAQLQVDWEAPVEVGGEVRSAINVHEFAKHVAELHADTDIGFSKEYESIQNECVIEDYASEHSQHPDNKLKNRYLNITAYDHSRVHLHPTPGQKKSIDYINANFIDGYHKSRAFIGTQGPLPGTFDCFWRMIWEQRVAIVVMITNLVERGRRKCDMYWPRTGTETYGVIQVRLVHEEVTAMYTVRTFGIRHLKLKKKKQMAIEKIVYQYHYTNWPDHGTPEHALPVLNFVKKSAAANPTEAGPIVVHCSAGVGRTGTYIVLDAMLRQIQHKGVLNVFGFLRHIRAQRNFLVQTEEQYIFLHDALVEAIDSGETIINSEIILKQINDLAYQEHQFKLITQYQPKEANIASAIKPANAMKNRSGLLPLEGSRVHLTPKAAVDGSDYINASWFHGFRRLRDYVVTQHPLPNTVIDFWQMVHDHNIPTIVLLSQVDDMAFHQFWPMGEAEVLENENYRVRFHKYTEGNDHLVYQFEVESIHDETKGVVNMVYCPTWPNLVNSLSVYETVAKVHARDAGNAHCARNGPIVVVDRYGGAPASIFCAVASLAMEMEYDKTCSIYAYAKLYHDKRPGIWSSVEEIQQIYRILTYMPTEPCLLKLTEIRTEFEDQPTATPDLYSKICSNGNISSQLLPSSNSLAMLNGNGQSMTMQMTTTTTTPLVMGGSNGQVQPPQEMVEQPQSCTGNGLLLLAEGGHNLTTTGTD